MQNELRKLAAELRKCAADEKQQKFVKCAQVIRSYVGLGILKKKLGKAS
jgi:hypothetical protein